MVPVCEDRVLLPPPGEPDRAPQVKTDGSAAASRLPGKCRVAARAQQWPLPHTPSRWEGICSRRERASARPRKPAFVESESGQQGMRVIMRALPETCVPPQPVPVEEYAHLRLKFPEFDSQHKAPGMQDEIESRGSMSTWRRRASRMRRLMRLRSCALPSTLPAVRPTRGPGGNAALA